MPLVDAGEYYAEYHGHKVEHLEAVHGQLRDVGVTQFVYLAGDSSLDNKHWFFEQGQLKNQQLSAPSSFVAQAVNGYERVLSPPHMVQDVTYWLNCELAKRAKGQPHIAALNCAVEESCIVQREVAGLLPQDCFIRDHITKEDVLVVDMGGNDVALSPTCGVIFNIAWLLYCTPTCFIRAGPCCAWGLWYFIHMFRRRLRHLIERLIERQKPKKVVVCMLYYLDEKPGGSWADGVLGMLGYDKNPGKLQAAMRQIYAWGVRGIQIPGVEVVALPLYDTLDGKNTTDYVQRVEPSVTGGRKMAQAIAKKIVGSTIEPME